MYVFGEASSVSLNKHVLWAHIHHTQNHSMASLSRMTSALHAAVQGLLAEAQPDSAYYVDDASVFNSLVVSCLKTVPQCLSHHLSWPPPSQRGRPSAQNGWGKVKSIVRTYLLDLIVLLENLKDQSMQCALLKHIRSLTDYYLCFPKICKRLVKMLVVCWSEGDSHTRVMAFVVLRHVTLNQPHPALHRLLKVYEI